VRAWSERPPELVLLHYGPVRPTQRDPIGRADRADDPKARSRTPFWPVDFTRRACRSSAAADRAGDDQDFVEAVSLSLDEE
jgi:hypothetical protein